MLAVLAERKMVNWYSYNGELISHRNRVDYIRFLALTVSRHANATGEDLVHSPVWRMMKVSGRMHLLNRKTHRAQITYLPVERPVNDGA